jgi:hypothetical protein
MPEGFIAPHSGAECQRLAWRYLSRSGLAPLASPDPLGQAVHRLAAQTRSQIRDARRDMAAAGGTTLAGIAALVAWLSRDHPSVTADLVFRVVAAVPLTFAIIGISDATTRLARAWRLSRIIADGRVEEALRQVLLQHW